MKSSLPGIKLHPTKGSPSKPDKQLHIGRWLTTLHRALKPQDPTHGSLHLLATQDNVRGQSWSIKHSGRQLGGAPSMPGKQEHTALSLTVLHSELDPHGEGTHGDIGGNGFRSGRRPIH